ncbi:RNA polymerase sigma factor [Lewinella cohaerens]|uniref:RNA polymerase sigma factor n=1 Tax=Lewinella cohaerens TaxID=70995 RepID=UPI0003622620|nr:sigma-70 family RNA polymerase sigma factor [Lewinella cohaerens]
MELGIQLIERCIANERAAQRQLYEILMPYLNLICKRYLNHTEELQDTLQEVFILIFKNIRQFDVQRASFKTWATQIAINCCLKNNTVYQRKGTQELIVPLHETPVDPTIIKTLSERDLLRWLKKMPEPYFQVFNLYVVDGFSHREIAELLQIDESLSRQRLTRSRAWLKQRLPEHLQTQLHLNKL